MTETRMDRMDRRDGALLRKVGDVIAAEPERYDQGWYIDMSKKCGTTACIAGHVALLHPGYKNVSLGGIVIHTDDGANHDVSELARSMLGLNPLEGNSLFSGGWRPAGDPATPLHERVRDALYALAMGATVEEVSA